MIPTSPLLARQIVQRAKDAAWRISQKPTTVVFKAGAGATAAARPAQVVRIEVDNRASMLSSTAGAAPRMQAIVYGVRGHPSIPDTDIKEHYTFKHLGDDYTIVDIILQLGEIQAIATAAR